MNNKKINTPRIFGLSVLLIVAAGCGRMTTSSSGSVTVDGRQITYTIDGPSSLVGTDPLIIKFGKHKLERQRGNFLLDGRNIGSIGGSDRIDLVVSNSVLTMISGNNTGTIPFTR